MDVIVHVGDFAYDLHQKGGTVGDHFFENIEQIGAYVPYMVSVGNHENIANSLARYTEQFRHVPTTSGTVRSDNGKAPNNWYYSWDTGLVHYIAISTEIPFTQFVVLTEQMLQWVKSDLEAANANRDKVPWIVVHGHRSLYCSCDKDCDENAAQLRLLFEKMFFDQGVDFFINGHEHNYERNYPTYKNKTTQSNVDPNAPIYIVTGAAGSHELHEPFTRPQPPRSAFRSNSFGYSRMYVHNHTHIQWQQVQTDPTMFPEEDYGRVIDDTWFIQHSHGPFSLASAPRDDYMTLGHTQRKGNDTAATYVYECQPPTCRSHDHWTPLLKKHMRQHMQQVQQNQTGGGGATTWKGMVEPGMDMDDLELIESFREVYGEGAWRAIERSCMVDFEEAQGSNHNFWEDVREDGSSDGAWEWRGSES
jgi:hypothetical protein